MRKFLAIVLAALMMLSCASFAIAEEAGNVVRYAMGTEPTSTPTGTPAPLAL